jgi:hypothetical protein
MEFSVKFTSNPTFETMCAPKVNKPYRHHMNIKISPGKNIIPFRLIADSKYPKNPLKSCAGI